MASMRTAIASLQVSRGLAAAAIGWACGVAVTYAVGSAFRPLYDVGQGGSWYNLRSWELARLVLPAAAAAAPMAAAAFATYAPRGKYRVIETLGVIFLTSIPFEWMLVGSLPRLRSRYEVHWWLHPLELACVLGPAIFFGGLLAFYRAQADAEHPDPSAE